jgi:alkylation response protein AidB-like acyl-CoA dehydrogenase
MPADPRIVHWSDHALAKAELLGFARADVEQIVLAGHRRRTSNSGAADWLTEAGRLVVAYNHPDGGDEIAALIVSLWRRA